MSKSQSFDQTGTNIDQKIKWAQQIYSIQISNNVNQIEEFQTYKHTYVDLLYRY